MNQKTPYELTITGKLEQVPLPDLQDSIWARIERQLDVDMPSGDDDGNNPGPQPPSGGGFWIGGIGLSVFVVALLTIFFINKNNKIPNNPQTETAKPPAQTVNPHHQEDKPPPGAIILPARTTPAPQNTSVPVAGDTALATAGAMPPAAPLQDSSSAVNSAAVPPVTAAAPAPGDTTPPHKRPRGVPGITSDDYRIVPKKDTAGQQ